MQLAGQTNVTILKAQIDEAFVPPVDHLNCGGNPVCEHVHGVWVAVLLSVVTSPFTTVSHFHLAPLSECCSIDVTWTTSTCLPTTKRYMRHC